MCIRRLKTVVALFVSCLLVTPDTDGKQPKGWTSESDDPESGAFGVWIEIRQEGTYFEPDGAFEGELIAVDFDSLYVFRDDRLQGHAKSDATTATIRIPERGKVNTVAWTALGAVSTLTHGVWLIGTLPAWIIVGIAATRSQARGARLRYPDATWEEIGTFARFPQGLPQGIDLSRLISKQAALASAHRDSQVVTTASPGGH